MVREAHAGSVGESPWLGTTTTRSGTHTTARVGTTAAIRGTNPTWLDIPSGRATRWRGPLPPTPPQEPERGVRSFLGRHPLAFFGGILLVLAAGGHGRPATHA